ncbi:aldehyde dehydrogenase family protein [Granulicoccus phenolivorans]|uniref:aldehyde dehydrogenase family protein n=1 Tax=Granulicoccus phenolivorans TaxID=266854 RepID=UPI0004179259|nr:aldehyde dehydrogenase family protein [Granulicoccus phenolivorans]
MLTLTGSVRADLSDAITQLRTGADRWAGLSLAARVDLFTRTRASIGRQAERWVGAARAAKGPVPAGEEWLSGPYALLVNLAVLAESLDALAHGRSPAAHLVAGTAPGGRATLKILPTNAQQRLLFHGYRADIWLQPGRTAEQARAEAGLGARRTGERGGVALVLGGGNVTSIGPLDVIYQLVAANRTSLLKVNPTFAGLVEVYRAALAPLVSADLLRVVAGDAAVGAYLVEHPGIDHVHLTGSARTHDAVVWGTGAEAEQRRAAGRPRVASVTSELGGVSPTIVIPGTWSAADLRYQAEQVATQRLHNSGHNCIATQVLVLSRDWPQRAAFLDQLRRVLAELPRTPWYPGARERLAHVDATYPDEENLAGCRLIEARPEALEEIFDTEYFAPALGHTSLPGTGEAFFRRAVEFANTRLAGTLGAGVLVSPTDRRAMGSAFTEVLADLKYGGIGVNVWSALDFAWPTAAWGAYPGNTLAAVGSGIGVVHNGYLLADTERTVAYGPFRPFPRSLRGEFALSPKPPWFLTSRSSELTAQRMTAYAEQPGWGRLMPVLPAAFRA